MFLRTHRIRGYAYTEALESYRDPATGKPKHRCIGRWKAEQSFAAALGEARFTVERDRHEVAVYQARMVDRLNYRALNLTWATLRLYARAPKLAKEWQARLAISTKHLAGLEAVQARQPAPEADIQAGFEAARQDWARWSFPPRPTAPATPP